MRISCRACQRAASKAAQKEAKLRSLIELYHASASFPHRSNMLPAVDAALLSHKLVPQPLRFPDLLHEHAALRDAGESPFLARTDPADRASILKAMPAWDPAAAYRPAPRHTTRLDRLQTDRWVQVADALHGTASGARATLETIQQRQQAEPVDAETPTPQPTHRGHAS